MEDSLHRLDWTCRNLGAGNLQKPTVVITTLKNVLLEFWLIDEWVSISG
jgi:hypothetical protein